MTHPESTNQWSPDIARVSQEIASRLRARGIEINDADTPDHIVQVLEAVEEFESTVEAHGGDLMVDEPPTTRNAQPDDPDYLLPTRAADESVQNYIKRLNAATARVREHRPHS